MSKRALEAMKLRTLRPAGTPARIPVDPETQVAGLKTRKEPGTRSDGRRFKKVTLELDLDLHKRLLLFCATRDVAKLAVCEAALDRYLNEESA